MDQQQKKQRVADAALSLLPHSGVIGIGSGSTVFAFIDAVASIAQRFDGVVVASEESKVRCQQHGMDVLTLNEVSQLSVYIDGADEFTSHGDLIKGGGGALTREKILATASDMFLCLVDDSKAVGTLGQFPVAVEVLDMARSFVARQLVGMGANPVYRQGFVTDNGHVILDVHQLDLCDPKKMEMAINQIPGVVANGVFSVHRPDKILVASDEGVTVRDL